MQLRVLSTEDFNRIHEATLRVLEKTGVWFKDCPEAHELFAANGCRIDDGCVKFPPQLVADALAGVPDRNTIRPFFPELGYAQPLSVKQGESHFGLIGNAYHIYDCETARKLFGANGYGGMVGFVIAGGEPAQKVFCASLKLCKAWVSLGDLYTLVYVRWPEARKGVPPGYVRVSVGLEDAEDIIADLDQALNNAHSTSR